MVVVMPQPLVQDRAQVEVLKPKLLCDGNHPRIDLTQQTVDHLEAEIHADRFLPRFPDPTMPKPPHLFVRVLLFEPGLAHHKHAWRSGDRVRSEEHTSELQSHSDL